MAAGWLRTLRSDQPAAVQAMREVGNDITAEQPEKLDHALGSKRKDPHVPLDETD